MPERIFDNLEVSIQIPPPVPIQKSRYFREALYDRSFFSFWSFDACSEMFHKDSDQFSLKSLESAPIGFPAFWLLPIDICIYAGGYQKAPGRVSHSF